MKILVDGEIKDLTMIDKNGTECTENFLGDDDLCRYDEEKGMYTMPDDDFEWWSDIADKFNKIEEMESKLTSEELEEYYSESFAGDLEDIVEAQFNWLSEKREAKEITEKKPSVLGKIREIKAEQKAQEAEKPAPQKAKSNNQEL